MNTFFSCADNSKRFGRRRRLPYSASCPGEKYRPGTGGLALCVCFRGSHLSVHSYSRSQPPYSRRDAAAMAIPAARHPHPRAPIARARREERASEAMEEARERPAEAVRAGQCGEMAELSSFPVKIKSMPARIPSTTTATASSTGKTRIA